MHHRPSRIRRRSSSLSAILCDHSYCTTPDSSSHHHLKCTRAPPPLSPHEIKRYKKQCRSWGSRDSIIKSGDCSTLRSTQPTVALSTDPTATAATSGYSFPSSTAHFGLAPAPAHSAAPPHHHGLLATSPRRYSLDTTASLSTTPPSIFFHDETHSSSPSSSPSSSTSSSYKSPLAPFPLCSDSEEGMDLDDPPPPPPSSSSSAGSAAAELAHLTQLHHLAFAALRSSTYHTEEDFLGRLRRWEQERVGSEMSMMDGGGEGTRGLPCSPEQGVGVGVGCDSSCSEGEEEEEAEEVAFILSPPPPPAGGGLSSSLPSQSTPSLFLSSPISLPHSSSSARPKIKRSDSLEIDELSRKLRAGALGLEDFGAVREWQGRVKERSNGGRG